MRMIWKAEIRQNGKQNIWNLPLPFSPASTPRPGNVVTSELHLSSTCERMCPFSLPTSLFNSSTVDPMAEPAIITITICTVSIGNTSHHEDRIEGGGFQSEDVGQLLHIGDPACQTTVIEDKNLTHFLVFHRWRPAYYYTRPPRRRNSRGVAPFTMHRMLD